MDNQVQGPDQPPSPPPAASRPRPIPPPISLSQSAAILGETQPWVRFLGVLGFVMVGFMLLVGLGTGVFGIASGQPEMAALIVVYPLMALLYFFPSLYLVRFASRIREFTQGQRPQQLEAALVTQRSFWRFVGILSLVGIIIALLGIGLAIAIPAFLAARG